MHVSFTVAEGKLIMVNAASEAVENKSLVRRLPLLGAGVFTKKVAFLTSPFPNLYSNELVGRRQGTTMSIGHL